MENMLDDFLKMMASFEPGSMIFEHMTNLDEGRDECIFFIREDPEYIQSIPENPVVEVKALALNIEDVVIVMIQSMFNRDPNTFYEMCMNYYSEGKDYDFYYLSNQEKLKFVFVDSNGEMVRNIVVENGIAEGIKKAKEEAEKLYPGWSMESFDKAKLEVYNRFPSPLHLWHVVA